MIVNLHHTTHTSILITSDYLKLGQPSFALEAYPAAAQAVGSALAELEVEAAKDITERKTPLLLEACAMLMAADIRVGLDPALLGERVGLQLDPGRPR